MFPENSGGNSEAYRQRLKQHELPRLGKSKFYLEKCKECLSCRKEFIVTSWCQFLPSMMLFLDDFCSKLDVIDKTYHGNQNTRGRVEIVDHRHCVSASSFFKLLLLQSGSRHKTKRDLDEPNIFEVVSCRRNMNHEILQALQLGIRHFAVQYMALPKKELSPLDFKSTQSTWIRYTKQHSKSLPLGTVTDFQWKDYFPAVFRHLQELGHIDYADYIMSVCGRETLKEISSPGKSGSLFFRSKDDRFVIKTLRKSEVKVLCAMLPNYLCHVKRYGSSLLTKLYGLHAARPTGGLTVYFVVMDNVLQSDLCVHQCYDLKGSSQGRTIGKAGDHEGAVFKDLDLDYLFYLRPLMWHQLLVQIKYDCNFLEAQGIMDYSLLLGIHIEGPRQDTNNTTLDDSLHLWKDSQWARAVISQIPDRPGAKLGVKIPARAIRSVPRNGKDHVAHHEEVEAGKCYNAFLCLGIIDIFQGYNMRKHLEHAYKSMQYNSKSISVVNPRVYSARFQIFLCKVFLAEEFDL